MSCKSKGIYPKVSVLTQRYLVYKWIHKSLGCWMRIFIYAALGCEGEERTFLSNHSLVHVSLRGWGVLRRWEKQHLFFVLSWFNAPTSPPDKVVVIAFVTALRNSVPLPSSPADHRSVWFAYVKAIYCHMLPSHIII